MFYFLYNSFSGNKKNISQINYDVIMDPELKETLNTKCTFTRY